MTLDLGDALSIPVRRLSPGMLAERLGITGEEASGLVAFRIQSDYENAIRASIRMDFEGKQLVVMEDEVGQLRIRRLYNVAGVCSEIRIFTQYKR